MALVLLILQTLILIAGLSLAAQFIVAIFNWRRRHENPVYQLFDIVTRPVTRLVRLITPRIVVDQHIPLAAFALLVVGYLAVGLAHRDVCLSDLGQPGCEKWAAVRAGAVR